MGIQIDKALCVISLGQDSHIIDKSSGILDFGKKLAIDAIRMDFTVLSGVEDQGI